jgi:hypothetical protein
MTLRVFADLAEEKIQQSLRRGDFDDLPGKGAPLELEDESMIPEDMRMAFKVLKNAGYLPPRIAQEKEILAMRDLIEHIGDAGERYRQIRKLNLLITKYNISNARKIALEKNQLYHEKIVSRAPVRPAEPEGGA